MIKIDANSVPFEGLNAAVQAADSRDITIQNALGQRYLGSGAINRRITIEGVAGNALGAYLDSSEITVLGNAQDALGDTMNSGSVTVHGHAGDTVGYAMRGGEILVRDYAGFRVGIHMKEYGEHIPKIVVGGTAGDFLGEYQAGGVILVLGIGSEGTCPVGAFCATGMYGGKIYIRSTHAPEDLPPQVECTRSPDIAEILPLLRRYCEAFGADFNALKADEYILLTPSTSNIYKRLYCNRSI